jgi:hypothetical protein
MTNYEQRIQSALDEYGATLLRHQHDNTNDGCTCGWHAQPFAANKARSTGLHIKAAHRAAERLLDAKTEGMTHV